MAVANRLRDTYTNIHRPHMTIIIAEGQNGDVCAFVMRDHSRPCINESGCLCVRVFVCVGAGEGGVVRV